MWSKNLSHSWGRPSIPLHITGEWIFCITWQRTLRRLKISWKPTVRICLRETTFSGSVSTKLFPRLQKLGKSPEKSLGSWALRKERGTSKVRARLRGRRVTAGPFSQGPHLVRLEVVPASPSNQEEVPQNLTEVSQLSPSPSQDQTKNPSFPVNPVTVGNKDVSVSPRVELNINLLHEAVKKLHLVPAEMDYPVGGRLRHFLGNWKLLTQGSHTFFNFKFKDFSRLNRWFSRSHQCKIPGLFQVKLMFFVARKPKLIRIMHLHKATTCKLLWSALYISACFFLFLNPLQSSPMSGTMDVNMYQRSLLFKQFGSRSGRIKCLASSGSKLVDTGCTCHKNVRHIIIL